MPLNPYEWCHHPGDLQKEVDLHETFGKPDNYLYTICCACHQIRERIIGQIKTNNPLHPDFVASERPTPMRKKAFQESARTRRMRQQATRPQEQPQKS